MGCSLRELFQRFDSRELSDWQTYYDCEPWGWKQDNLRFGTLATIAAPKSADTMATVENWFTDELPEIPLYEV
jgi:hypothetical protein